MRARAVIAAVAATSALFLVLGCATPQPAPAPPTAEEVRIYNQHLLDLTYDSNYLDGNTPRILTKDVTPSDVSGDELFSCLQQTGLPAVGYSIDTLGGYTLAADTPNQRFSPRARIILYTCVAEHPANPLSDGSLVTPAERRYLWQYWNAWLIPCLQSTGHTTPGMPTESQVLAADQGLYFSPYDLVPRPTSTRQEGLFGAVDRFQADMVAQCGAPFGVIARLNALRG